jgi:hypothetical protein
MLRKKPDMDTHVAIWSACLPVSRRQQALSSVDLGILNCHWHRKTWTEPFCISAVSAHTFLSVHLKCQPQSTACVAVESKINMNPIWKEHQELKGSANMRLEPLYYIYIILYIYCWHVFQSLLVQLSCTFEGTVQKCPSWWWESKRVCRLQLAGV